MRRLAPLFLVLLFSVSAVFAQGFQAKTDRRLQKAFSDSKSGKKRGLIRVIIQTDGDPDSRGVSSFIRGVNGKPNEKFEGLSGLAAEIPIEALEKVANHPSVRRISPDDKVFGQAGLTDYMTPAQITNFLATVDSNRVVTGAPEAWFKYGVNGQGIGVAVIDSGIAEVLDITNVVRTVDFTKSPLNGRGDPYGHGTHVAGVLGGMGLLSGFKYVGVAPQVNLVNLRVLDSKGTGYTSTVIKAIEWAIANRNATGNNGQPMNIRVINLSIGHAPYESADNDPLTLACRKAVQAGIVVVVSAGNYGSDENDTVLFGGITSPGTEPSVITVGAMSTWNTPSRMDDAVASYSSRGPTIDGLIKPDIMAPGSRIVGPMSPNNRLAKDYPEVRLNSFYMRLSGTSMSAPMVAGAAALILQKNPQLTPNAVKAILMYTAERTNKNPLEVGAGYLNVLGAVNLAANINAKTGLGQYWILNSGTSLTHTDHLLTGDTIIWGDTIVWGDSLSSFTNNLFYNQLAWGSTIVWGDTIVWSDTIVWDVLEALNALLKGQTIVWGDMLAEDYDEDVDAEAGMLLW